jgi:hypothetical protein
VTTRKSKNAKAKLANRTLDIITSEIHAAL